MVVEKDTPFWFLISVFHSEEAAMNIASCVDRFAYLNGFASLSRTAEVTVWEDLVWAAERIGVLRDEYVAVPALLATTPAGEQQDA